MLNKHTMSHETRDNTNFVKIDTLENLFTYILGIREQAVVDLDSHCQSILSVTMDALSAMLLEGGDLFVVFLQEQQSKINKVLFQLESTNGVFKLLQDQYSNIDQGMQDKMQNMQLKLASCIKNISFVDGFVNTEIHKNNVLQYRLHKGDLYLTKQFYKYQLQCNGDADNGVMQQEIGVIKEKQKHYEMTKKIFENAEDILQTMRQKLIHCVICSLNEEDLVGFEENFYSQREEIEVLCAEQESMLEQMAQGSQYTSADELGETSIQFLESLQNSDLTEEQTIEYHNLIGKYTQWLNYKEYNDLSNNIEKDRFRIGCISNILDMFNECQQMKDGAYDLKLTFLQTIEEKGIIVEDEVQFLIERIQDVRKRDLFVKEEYEQAWQKLQTLLESENTCATEIQELCAWLIELQEAQGENILHRAQLIELTMSNVTNNIILNCCSEELTIDELQMALEDQLRAYQLEQSANQIATDRYNQLTLAIDRTNYIYEEILSNEEKKNYALQEAYQQELLMLNKSLFTKRVKILKNMLIQVESLSEIIDLKSVIVNAEIEQLNFLIAQQDEQLGQAIHKLSISNYSALVLKKASEHDDNQDVELFKDLLRAIAAISYKLYNIENNLLEEAKRTTNNLLDKFCVCCVTALLPEDLHELYAAFTKLKHELNNTEARLTTDSSELEDLGIIKIKQQLCVKIITLAEEQFEILSGSDSLRESINDLGMSPEELPEFWKEQHEKQELENLEIQKEIAEVAEQIKELQEVVFLPPEPSNIAANGQIVTNPRAALQQKLLDLTNRQQVNIQRQSFFANTYYTHTVNQLINQQLQARVTATVSAASINQQTSLGTPKVTSSYAEFYTKIKLPAEVKIAQQEKIQTAAIRYQKLYNQTNNINNSNPHASVNMINMARSRWVTTSSSVTSISTVNSQARLQALRGANNRQINVHTLVNNFSSLCYGVISQQNYTKYLNTNKGVFPKLTNAALQDLTAKDTSHYVAPLAAKASNALKGEHGEAIMAFALEEEGWEKQLSHYNGNQGIDGVFSKVDGTGKLHLMLIESKNLSKAEEPKAHQLRTYKTNKVTEQKSTTEEKKNKGHQLMSESWLDAKIKEMKKSEIPKVKATGELLESNRELALNSRYYHLFNAEHVHKFQQIVNKPSNENKVSLKPLSKSNETHQEIGKIINKMNEYQNHQQQISIRSSAKVNRDAKDSKSNKPSQHPHLPTNHGEMVRKEEQTRRAKIESAKEVVKLNRSLRLEQKQYPRTFKEDSSRQAIKAKSSTATQTNSSANLPPKLDQLPKTNSSSVSKPAQTSYNHASAKQVERPNPAINHYSIYTKIKSDQEAIKNAVAVQQKRINQDTQLAAAKSNQEQQRLMATSRAQAANMQAKLSQSANESRMKQNVNRQLENNRTNRMQSQASNNSAQEAQRRATQESQRRTAQEAQRRAAQEAQQRATQEANRRAQEVQRRAQEVQQRAAQQEAQRRAVEAQRRAAQEAAQRAAQEAQRRAAQESQRRAAQQEAQRRAAQEAQRVAQQRAAQQEAQRRAAQEAAQRAAQQEAQRRAIQEAQQRAAQEAQRRAAQEAAQRQNILRIQLLQQQQRQMMLNRKF